MALLARSGRVVGIVIAVACAAASFAPDAAAHWRSRRSRGGYGAPTWGGAPGCDTGGGCDFAPPYGAYGYPVPYGYGNSLYGVVPVQTQRRSLLGYAVPGTPPLRRSLMGYSRSTWWSGTGDGYGYGYVAPPAIVPTCGYRFYARPVGSTLWGRYGVVVPVATAEGEENPVVATAPPPAPLGDLARAQEAIFEGRAEDAVRGFEALVAKDATDVPAWTGLLHARFLSGDYAGGARALERLATLGAVSADARLDVAAAYGAGKSFPARLSALKARVRFHPDDADSRALLAYFESGVGEGDEARLDASIVLRSRPDDAAAKVLAAPPTECTYRVTPPR